MEQNSFRPTICLVFDMLLMYHHYNVFFSRYSECIKWYKQTSKQNKIVKRRVLCQKNTEQKISYRHTIKTWHPFPFSFFLIRSPILWPYFHSLDVIMYECALDLFAKRDRSTQSFSQSERQRYPSAWKRDKCIPCTHAQLWCNKK